MINIIRGKTAFHQLPPTSPQTKRISNKHNLETSNTSLQFPWVLHRHHLARPLTS